MASKEEVSNLSAHREGLRSLTLSNTEMSVEQILHHACIHHDCMWQQWVAAEDAQETAQLLDVERQRHGANYRGGASP